MANSGETALTYTVPRSRVGWELYEGTMPQSASHCETLQLIWDVLKPWVAERGGKIYYDLAVRWVEEDRRIGVNPDLAVLIPPPANLYEIESVCTWMEGHEPPFLAIEIVSETNPLKDYSIAPEKYAASGIKELWILDPLLFGPKIQGGPFRIQVFRRDELGFRRVYEGEGPVYSAAVDAHLVAIAEGRRFRLAKGPELVEFWLTAEEKERAAKEVERAAKEVERAAKEVERAAKEVERAAKEAALAEVEQLKAEIAKLKGG